MLAAGRCVPAIAAAATAVSARLRCHRTATLIPLLRRDGMSDGDIDRVFSTFNVAAFAAELGKQ